MYNCDRFSGVLGKRWQMEMGTALSLPSFNHHWIKASVVLNNSHDEFTREMLTSSGSNFRVGPVNRYPEQGAMGKPE